MKKILNIHPKLKLEVVADQPDYVYVTKFDEETYKKFKDDFNKIDNANYPVIPIVIDSFGGQVNALMGMISVIRSCKKPVATIVESKAMSAGVILASCGTKGYRYMSPLASLMIHEVSSSVYDKITDMKARIAYSDSLNTQIMEILNRNCDKPKGYFQKMIEDRTNTDWFIGAKEAKKLGIIDKIGTPELNITASLNITFK